MTSGTFSNNHFLSIKIDPQPVSMQLVCVKISDVKFIKIFLNKFTAAIAKFHFRKSKFNSKFDFETVDSTIFEIIEIGGKIRSIFEKTNVELKIEKI